MSYQNSMRERFEKYRLLLEKAGELHQKKADHLAIIDEFYAEDIVQFENESIKIEGKSTLREMEERNLSKIHLVNTTLKHVVIDEEEGVVWGEMQIEYLPNDGEVQFLKEAFLQKWKNHQIVYQKFFYKDA